MPGKTQTLLLLHAASTGNLSILKSFVAEFGYGGTEQGAKALMQVRDPRGQTLLHHAVSEGNTHVCEYLIQDLKLDVNPKNNMGYTPLHYAILEEQILTSVYLLNHGAEPNVACGKGLTPLHFAVWKGREDQLHLLISKGAEVDVQSYKLTPLHAAVLRGKKTVVKILLDNHANPNSVSSLGFTPLLLAIVKYSIACARLLLKAGADPSLRSQGVSPLLMAVTVGKTKIMECLLQHGADPNITNVYDFTPIEIAALHGSRAGVMTLFQTTVPIPKYPVWSVDGILEYVHSVEAVAQRESKFEEKFLEAKANGAERFARNAYYAAIYWYTEARIAKPNDATLCSNLSLCWARLNMGDLALKEALACIKFRPDWPKAYYRAGTAFKILQEYKEAAEAFEFGLMLDPGNKDLQNAKREAAAEAAAAALMIYSRDRFTSEDDFDYDVYCSMMSHLDLVGCLT